jgi:hypothetical protein
MNYPPEKQPPASDTKPSELSPRQLMEAATAQMIYELMQLRRTLWLVAKQYGPLTVDESKAHPLWRLKATRLDTGAMHLQATQLPDPTEEQLAALIETLNGSKTPLTDALAVTDLKDHPPAYIAFLLLPKITLREDGYWVDTALMQKPPGENN